MSRLSNWDRKLANTGVKPEGTALDSECWYCRKDLSGLLVQRNRCPLCQQTVCTQHFQAQRVVQGLLSQVCEACFLDPFKAVVLEDSRKEAARLEERAAAARTEGEQYERESSEMNKLLRQLEVELKAECELTEKQKALLTSRVQAEEARGEELRQASEAVSRHIEEISIEEKSLNERYLKADQLLQSLRSDLADGRKRKERTIATLETQTQLFQSLVNRNDLFELVCEKCKNQLTTCFCQTPRGFVAVNPKKP